MAYGQEESSAKRKESTRRKPGPKPGSTRKHRTADDRITALKDQIASIEAREKAKELKDDPGVKYAVTTARSLNRGVKLAEANKDTALQHAVADAHQAISDYLAEKGVRMPKARRPRGRRPN